MDAAASFVIYAPVDVAAMNLVLSGGDPDYVALLPSGFAILPDGRNMNRGGTGEIGAEHRYKAPLRFYLFLVLHF